MCPGVQALSHRGYAEFSSAGTEPVESLRLLSQIAAFGAPLPHLILTGGEPLSRKDLLRVNDEARALGLQVSLRYQSPADLLNDLKRLRRDSISAKVGGASSSSTPATTTSNPWKWASGAVVFGVLAADPQAVALG